MAKPHRPTQRAAAVAAIHLLVVIVAAMAVVASAAAAGARRRQVPPPAPPPPLVVGYKVYCTKAHGVIEGETCVSVARDEGISLSQFFELNPNITCRALFLGQWVCLHGVEVA